MFPIIVEDAELLPWPNPSLGQLRLLFSQNVNQGSPVQADPSLERGI